MKIGMLTSWNTQCGISEYSRHLVGALQRQGHEVVVFGSKNYDERKVAEDEAYVRPTFGVLPWNKYEDHSFDVETIWKESCDVIHIQYEVLLYNQAGLKRLLFDPKAPILALTYHDNCIPPDFPYDRFDLIYTHRESVGVGAGYVIPFGIENFKPVVKTFGLGRSRDDIIGDICLRNGFLFEKSFGEQTWKSAQELTEWLRDSDAIVLYYDDVPSAGSSQAARTALATRRKVFVSDTTWFEGLDETLIPNLTKVGSPEELELRLQEALLNHYIQDYSWDKVAELHVQDYEAHMPKV